MPPVVSLHANSACVYMLRAKEHVERIPFALRHLCQSSEMTCLRCKARLEGKNSCVHLSVCRMAASQRESLFEVLGF